VAAFNSWLSRINQFFFFSRTTDAEFPTTPEARRIASSYLRRVMFALGLALIAYASLVYFTPLSAVACFTLGLVVECVFCCRAFAQANREAGAAIAARGSLAGTPAPSQSVAVSLTERSVFTRPLMVMLVLAPIFAAAVWLISMQVAHLGFGAFADAVAAEKADFLTGLGIGMLAACLMLFVQLRYFSRHRSPFARFTANGCVQLGWLGALTIAFSAVTVPMHLLVTKEIKLALLGVALGVAMLRLVYCWAKMRMFTPPAVERGGDEFWRWGLFYYNPADPTLFIQHRSGPGYTVNFAKGMAWVMALLVVADFGYLVCIHLHR
jgi:hypothetical protein